MKTITNQPQPNNINISTTPNATTDTLEQTKQTKESKDVDEKVTKKESITKVVAYTDQNEVPKFEPEETVQEVVKQKIFATFSRYENEANSDELNDYSLDSDDFNENEEELKEIDQEKEKQQETTKHSPEYIKQLEEE